MIQKVQTLFGNSTTLKEDTMGSRIITKTFENEDVIVLNVNVNSFMYLKCGCIIPLHTLMLVMGAQVMQGMDCVCPLHKTDHDFTDDALMKEYAVIFLEHSQSGMDEPLVTTLPPPSR